MPISSSDFSVVAGGNFSILFAKKNIIDSYISLTYLADGIKEYRFPNLSVQKGNKAQEVKNFDAKIGLEYKISLSDKFSVFITGGYKYVKHQGVVNTYGQSQSFTSTRDPDNSLEYIVVEGAKIYGNKNDDLVSHGPFLKVGFKF